MKSSTRILTVITALSLVVMKVLCYVQPEPDPGPNEIGAIVAVVGTLVLSLQWTWNRLRGVQLAH